MDQAALCRTCSLSRRVPSRTTVPVPLSSQILCTLLFARVVLLHLIIRRTCRTLFQTKHSL